LIVHRSSGIQVITELNTTQSAAALPVPKARLPKLKRNAITRQVEVVAALVAVGVSAAVAVAV
ncbi:MAG: hypothetical protein ACO3C8_01260, partial [Bacilli bacterium]